MFTNINNFEAGLFDRFRRLEREMDQVFGQASSTRFSTTYPPVNVAVSEDRVDVDMFIPGVDPKRLSITLHKNLLAVKGEREAGMEKDVEYSRKERFGGEFHRAVNLPEDADSEKVDAAYENGVLHITIQRRESAKPRQIEVKTSVGE